MIYSTIEIILNKENEIMKEEKHKKTMMFGNNDDIPLVAFEKQNTKETREKQQTTFKNRDLNSRLKQESHPELKNKRYQSSQQEQVSTDSNRNKSFSMGTPPPPYHSPRTKFPSENTRKNLGERKPINNPRRPKGKAGGKKNTTFWAWGMTAIPLFCVIFLVARLVTSPPTDVVTVEAVVAHPKLEQSISDSKKEVAAVKATQNEQKEQEAVNEIFAMVDDEAEVYEVLRKRAAVSTKAAEIYENREAYPLVLLANFAHNGEMLDYVYNFLDTPKEVTGGLTEEEKNQDHPLLLQWDTRWGYSDYGDEIMAVSGCGPTALSMVVVSLTGNAEATPDQVAQYAVDNGYFAGSDGTAWALMSEGATDYGLSTSSISLDESAWKRALDDGEQIIAVMGAGHFTTGGHFIVIYGYNDEGFMILDSNNYRNTEAIWSYDSLASEMIVAWQLGY